VDDGPVIAASTTTTTTTTTIAALSAPSSSVHSEAAFKELLPEPSSSLTTETAAAPSLSLPSSSSQHLIPDFSSISYDTFNTAEILGKITKEDTLKSYGVQPLEFLLEIEKEPPLGGITFDPELILVTLFIICQINTIHFLILCSNIFQNHILFNCLFIHSFIIFPLIIRFNLETSHVSYIL